MCCLIKEDDIYLFNYFGFVFIDRGCFRKVFFVVIVCSVVDIWCRFFVDLEGDGEIEW